MEFSEKYSREKMTQFCLQINQNYDEMHTLLHETEPSTWEEEWYDAHLNYLHSLHDQLKYLSHETEKMKKKINKTKIQ